MKKKNVKKKKEGENMKEKYKKFSDSEYELAEKLAENLRKEYKDYITDVIHYFSIVKEEYIADLTLSLLHRYSLTDSILEEKELKRIYALSIIMLKNLIWNVSMKKFMQTFHFLQQKKKIKK